jgi:hypothetical protein
VAVVFYFTCRCRQEHFDLELLAEEVAAGAPDAAPGMFNRDATPPRAT